MDEIQVRLAAFAWLAKQSEVDDVFSWADLQRGFYFQGQRVTFVGQPGIWKPKVFAEIPLSIRTASNGPYDDAVTDDGFLLYRYRGTDPYHRDNAGLREAMRRQIPLVYFHALIPGRYLAVWPIFIVDDDPRRLTFTVAVDEERALFPDHAADQVVAEGAVHRRRYVTSLVRSRLHQCSFRERVLEAYQRQCSFCRLRHRELLDAAHIIADREEAGQPVVNNGLSLCKIHHAVFDRQFVGVTPDFEIVVREDLLREEDGPMLRYGIQDLHGQRLLLPGKKKHWPDRERLEHRFTAFRGAG